MYTHSGEAEAYNSTNEAMILEMTYMRKVPYHWPADSSSDWYLCVCITLAANEDQIKK